MSDSITKDKVISFIIGGFKMALALSFSIASAHAGETVILDAPTGSDRITSADEGKSFVFDNVYAESSSSALYGFYMLGTKVKNTTIDSVSGSLTLKTTGSGTTSTANIYGVYIRTGNNTINTLSGTYNLICDTSSTSSSGGSVYGVAVVSGTLYTMKDATLNVSTNSKGGDSYGVNLSNGAYGISGGVEFSNVNITVSGNDNVYGITGAERAASFEGNLSVSGVEGRSVSALKFDNTSGVTQKTFKLLGNSKISAVNGNSVRSAVAGNLSIVGDENGTQVLDGNIYIYGYKDTTSSISFSGGDFAIQNSSSGETVLNGFRDLENGREILYSFDGVNVAFNDNTTFSSTLVEINGGSALSSEEGKSLSFDNSSVNVANSQIGTSKLAIGEGSSLNATGTSSIEAELLSVFEGSTVSLDENSTFNIAGLEVILSELKSGTTYDLANIFGDNTTVVLSMLNNNITMSDTQGHTFDVVVSDDGQITAVPEPLAFASIFGALALGFAVYRKRR